MVTLKNIVSANKRLYVNFVDGTQLEVHSLDDLKRWATDIHPDVERQLVVRDVVEASDEKTITQVKSLTMDLSKVSPTLAVTMDLSKVSPTLAVL